MIMFLSKNNSLLQASPDEKVSWRFLGFQGHSFVAIMSFSSLQYLGSVRSGDNYGQSEKRSLRLFTLATKLHLGYRAVVSS